MSLVEVQPGNATGIFYIIVANLPWNCSWQKLKDFARNQKPDGSSIDIEHAHVYPDGTTGGWVRVKGRDNFVNTMERLSNGVLENRVLVVDGRNETNATIIKEEVFSAYGTSRRARRDSTSSHDTFPSPTMAFSRHRNNSSESTYSANDGWHGSTTSFLSPASSTVSFYAPSAQVFENYGSVTSYPSSDYFPMPPSPGVVYAGSMVTSTPVYLTPLQSPVTYTHPAPYLEVPFSPEAVPATIKTEARKIVITQLPLATSYRDLEHLLRKYITRNIPRSPTRSGRDELEELSIPVHSNQKPRGHAFAVLGSEKLARAVAEDIDGLRFQGRLIKVRLAKEGVESYQQYSTAEVPQTPSQSDFQYQTPAAGPLSSTCRPTETVIENPADQTPPAAVPRVDNKITRKGKEKEKKKSSSPAVVNGSSSGSTRERNDKGKKHRSWDSRGLLMLD